MKYWGLAAALLAILTTTPAFSQDAAYTNDDEIAMQGCIEAVNDINSSSDGAETASFTQCIGTASNLCQEQPDGASTLGIVACNQREQAWWDQWLNDTYNQLKDTLAADVFASLKAAQRAWLPYRDAKCAFVYEIWKDGTIRNVLASSCLLDETAHRATDLANAISG